MGGFEARGYFDRVLAHAHPRIRLSKAHNFTTSNRMQSGSISSHAGHYELQYVSTLCVRVFGRTMSPYDQIPLAWHFSQDFLEPPLHLHHSFARRRDSGETLAPTL